MGTRAQRDLGQLVERLRPWLTEKIGRQVSKISDVSSPKSAGFSNETLIFSAESLGDDGLRVDDLVIRLMPLGPTFLPDCDLDLQFGVMKSLHLRSGVPVPAMLWAENDPSVVGSKFFVMRKVEGRGATDDPPYTVGGWIMELSPQERSVLYDNALRALAAIHALDYRSLDLTVLDQPDPPRTALDLRFDFCHRYYEHAAQAIGRGNPFVDAGFDWLDKNRPSSEKRTVLNWGDARMGNMLFGADHDVKAVLDWEFACIASPEHDLAWWLFATRYFTEGIGAPNPEGFPDRAGTIRRYEEISGHTVENLEYYDVMTALIGAINMMRVAKMSIDGGVLPPDTDMTIHNGGTQILGRLIGMADVPTAPSETFRLR